MISGAILPPRAIALTAGERSPKLLLETFPELGLSCRTLALDFLCTAKDPGRWVLCTTYNTMPVVWTLLTISTVRNQHCSSAKPEEWSSWG